MLNLSFHYVVFAIEADTTWGWICPRAEMFWARDVPGPSWLMAELSGHPIAYSNRHIGLHYVGLSKFWAKLGNWWLRSVKLILRHRLHTFLKLHSQQGSFCWSCSSSLLLRPGSSRSIGKFAVCWSICTGFTPLANISALLAHTKTWRINIPCAFCKLSNLVHCQPS